MIKSYLEKISNIFEKHEGILETCNGLYNNDETVLRGLSHELVFWCKMGRKNKRVEFLLSELKIYLQSKSIHQHINTADFSNGVIGPSWLNEGLVAAFHISRDPSYIELIIQNNTSLLFDKSKGLWTRPSGGRIDQTINHQIWYAYSLALVCVEVANYQFRDEIISQVEIFLRQLDQKIHLYENGVMHHRSLKNFDLRSKLASLIRKREGDIRKNIDLVSKSHGYFPFVMLPLVMLRKFHPDNPFFAGEKWRKMLGALENHETLLSLENSNKYGVNYNLSVFELHVISIELGFSHISEQSIQRQINVIKNQEGKLRNLSFLKSYELMFFKKWGK